MCAGLDGEAAAPGTFGDVLMDVEAGVGWGHAIAWSPSGMERVFYPSWTQHLCQARQESVRL